MLTAIEALLAIAVRLPSDAISHKQFSWLPLRRYATHTEVTVDRTNNNMIFYGGPGKVAPRRGQRGEAYRPWHVSGDVVTWSCLQVTTEKMFGKRIKLLTFGSDFCWKAYDCVALFLPLMIHVIVWCISSLLWGLPHKRLEIHKTKQQTN